MRFLVLGSAAGGGFPQWNCLCPNCRLAWERDPRAERRSQASLAVSRDGDRLGSPRRFARPAPANSRRARAASAKRAAPLADPRRIPAQRRHRQYRGAARHARDAAVHDLGLGGDARPCARRRIRRGRREPLPARARRARRAGSTPASASPSRPSPSPARSRSTWSRRRRRSRARPGRRDHRRPGDRGRRRARLLHPELRARDRRACAHGSKAPICCSSTARPTKTTR